MNECHHEFSLHCKVALFSDNPGNGSLGITGVCRHCGTPLRFQGCDIGIGSRPMASPDRLELRAPVTFGDAAFSPGPTTTFRVFSPFAGKA